MWPVSIGIGVRITDLTPGAGKFISIIKSPRSTQPSHLRKEYHCIADVKALGRYDSCLLAGKTRETRKPIIT